MEYLRTYIRVLHGFCPTNRPCVAAVSFGCMSLSEYIQMIQQVEKGSPIRHISLPQGDRYQDV